MESTNKTFSQMSSEFITFEDIYYNAKAKHYFRMFMVQQDAVNIWNIIHEIEYFETLQDNALKHKQATLISNMFLKNGAIAGYVPLTSWKRVSLTLELVAHPPPMLFESVKQICINNLKNKWFPEFLESKLFVSYIVDSFVEQKEERVLKRKRSVSLKLFRGKDIIQKVVKRLSARI